MDRPTSRRAREDADAGLTRDPTRRQAVGLVGAGLTALSFGQPAAAQSNSTLAIIQNALGEGQHFSASRVTDLARTISGRPFQAPANDLPAPFAGLNYEQYVAIKPRPSARIWEGEARGFVAEALPRGFVFNTNVTLFTVEDSEVRRVAFDRSRFDFGALNVPANTPDLGFSGFRLISTLMPDRPFEFAIVQGACFFRCVGLGQNFGVVARALALKPAEARGEEFPFFRAFWIERPTPGTNALVVHGLVDSESVAGAVRMTFRPGEVTIVDVETTLFPRVNLEHVGFGGMGTMFLFGPNVRQTTDDVRPAVYEASALQMWNGQGEWLFRPLNNPDTLQISAFVDENPKGFGLIQRERSFAAFQDDVQHYEKRTSLWVQPLGDWVQGAVQLIEIPSDSQVNNNILTYWRPKAVMAPGSEVTANYRQFWCWTPPDRPSLAAVVSTRSGRGSGGRRRRFVVAFEGDALANAGELDVKPVLTAGPGTIQNARLWSYPDRKVVRVAFELDPGSETACELRLVLQSGAKPLSETWLYRWTP